MKISLVECGASTVEDYHTLERVRGPSAAFRKFCVTQILSIALWKPLSCVAYTANASSSNETEKEIEQSSLRGILDARRIQSVAPTCSTCSTSFRFCIPFQISIERISLARVTISKVFHTSFSSHIGRWVILRMDRLV